ncbi:MAG: accessory factor UbiK family protein [Alphaproteobacteria bacterium]|nr:accessory factor UbiK family protein [Alphaproteobacteria bacterium]
MIGRGKEKFLDDIARVAGGTVSVFSGLGRNLREEIKARADEAATRLDLVPREDFERLETVLRETRKIVEEQQARIGALEQNIPKKTASKK